VLSEDEQVGGRRRFLKGMSVGGLALAAPAVAASTLPAGPNRRFSVPLIPARAMETAAVDTGPTPSQAAAGAVATPATVKYGSDYMVDILRDLGITTFAEIPGSTFAGLQESIVNYGMHTTPEVAMFTVTHEEIAVSFAHGYAKVTGEPAVALVHSVVGLQHASMAIYNAWCDRAPVITITGSLTDPESRDGFVDWMHAVSDGPALTRDFTKFDETPRTLPHFAESMQRGYRMAMTPPCGPVVIAADFSLQERTVTDPAKLPKVTKPKITAPQGDMGALRELAAMLVQASAPVILADRAARTPAGMAAIVTLAELLGAGVVDVGGRMNFPWRHPLNQTSRGPAVLRAADLVLGLEVQDFAGASRPARKAKKVSISTYDYYLKANYQAFEPLPVVDLAIAGDSEASLPSLIEAVRQALPASARSAAQARAAALAEASAAALAASREAAAIGWDVSPITTARMFAEVYDQVHDKDWALLGADHFMSLWGQRLWDGKHHHQFIGDSGAYGLGYLPGAAVGAAYAHKQHGRIPIAFIGDGDLMMAPGALFTAAYHKIPVLYIVHNNGGYHQEVMKVQLQANLRDRGVKAARTGCVLPDIDYAQIARGMGVAAQRVTEPGDLRAAIRRSLDVVGRGEPALIDVVSQGR
jgi:thiamine pyrophosphate-dependent acetolactate synthase large subunit-like protein